MNIKQLQKISHKQAIDKGFWYKADDLDSLRTPSGVQPRNLSELLMLIVSELGEACEALRKNSRQIRSKNKKWAKSDGWCKDTFEDELADVIIRICDLAESEGIDLEWQISNKLLWNKKRPYKHGKEF
uniref:Putative nucleotide pyrophosphohydrolase domain-containing protein n=1 Tax=viral metagenome TaxID=1070528 RepID=A0A6M3JTN2_9ZZZZ